MSERKLVGTIPVDKSDDIHSIEGRDLYKSTQGARDSMGNPAGYSHKPTHVPNAKGRPWPKEMGKRIISVDSRLDGLD